MASVTRPRIPYFPALDGLRGAALVVMLVYHDGARWIGGGYLSVSTFFTLSGFLITALLLAERDTTGRIDLVRFWERRLRRLMPAALLGIALAAGLAAAAGTQSDVWRLRWDGLAALLYFANFRFMAAGNSYWEIFTRPSPVQHYWSLSIEEQFYFVYPLLLLAIPAIAGRSRAATRSTLVVLALLSALVMAALSVAGVAPARLYYGTDTRAAEFLAGAVLATLIVRGGDVHPWCGRGAWSATLAALAFVAASLLLVEEDSAFLYRGGFALYALATAVVINAALRPGLLRSTLAWWPLRRLGETSYGAYVVHWPVYLWLDETRTGLHGMRLIALRLAVTIGLATASYVLVERPVRAGRWPRGLAAPIAVPAGVAAVAALIVAVSANPPPMRRPHTRLVAMPEVGPAYPAGPLRILVLGDSLAFNVGSGLVAWARAHPGVATVWNYAYFGCGVARDRRRGRLVTELQRCGEWRDGWEVAVDRFRPDVVLILSGVWDLRDGDVPPGGEVSSPGDAPFDAWLLAELQLAVDVASSRGARVLWLNTPCIGPVPPGSPLLRLGAAEPERIEHLNRVLLPALAASRARQMALFDLYGRLCPEGRFIEVDAQRRQLRSDYLHLSGTAATEIAAAIMDAVRGDERSPTTSGASAGRSAGG